MPLSTADSGGLFGTAAEKAYILYGLLIGLAFGPVQASSRSYMARSVTVGRIRPLFRHLCTVRPSDQLPGAVHGVDHHRWLSGSARLGMAAIVLFLAVGMAILIGTPYPADRPVE